MQNFIKNVRLISDILLYRQLSSMSPSGKLQAIVRKVPGKNGQEEKQFLEVTL